MDDNSRRQNAISKPASNNSQAGVVFMDWLATLIYHHAQIQPALPGMDMAYNGYPNLVKRIDGEFSVAMIEGRHTVGRESL